jgi:ATP-dependent Clp protease ATP-binding subunit ClpC
MEVPFTDRTRRVVVLAQHEARVLRHDRVGTEHLVLGLLAENVELEDIGVTLEDARQRVDGMRAKAETEPTPDAPLPFTPPAVDLLRSSAREARRLGRTAIEPDDLLAGADSQVLRELGIDPDAVRAWIKPR